MKARCIQNRYNNASFTEGKKYEMSKDGIRCDWGGVWTKFSDWDRPRRFYMGEIFNFAMCKFQICD